MPKKRYAPEEIVAKLRHVDVLVSQGQNIADAIRQIGVSQMPADELLDGEIFHTLREGPDRYRKLAAPLQYKQAARH